MPMTTEDAVRMLLDRAAIQDVLQRYAHGVDQRDIDLVTSCFTPDASYKGALGEGTIHVALEALRERMQRYERTMHFIGNQLIELRGDEASSETYAIAYHQILAGDEHRHMAVGVRYMDELVRREERWLIRKRLVHLEWQRNDVVFVPDGGEGAP